MHHKLPVRLPSAHQVQLDLRVTPRKHPPPPPNPNDQLPQAPRQQKLVLEVPALRQVQMRWTLDQGLTRCL